MLRIDILPYQWNRPTWRVYLSRSLRNNLTDRSKVESGRSISKRPLVDRATKQPTSHQPSWALAWISDWASQSASRLSTNSSYRPPEHRARTLLLATNCNKNRWCTPTVSTTTTSAGILLLRSSTIKRRIVRLIGCEYPRTCSLSGDDFDWRTKFKNVSLSFNAGS